MGFTNCYSEKFNMSQIDTKKPPASGRRLSRFVLNRFGISYGSITLFNSDAFSMSTMYMTGGKASDPEPPPGTTA